MRQKRCPALPFGVILCLTLIGGLAPLLADKAEAEPAQAPAISSEHSPE